MTDFLVKRFVKNYEDVNDVNVRKDFSMLSGIVGIVCNIFLFALKYLIGTLSHSISVISDAFNNLSDCAGCFVTLIGCRLAAKPADKDHPFGHGRMEYLTSLTIAGVIIAVGIELLISSADRIANPTRTVLSAVVLASLLLSIAVKLWMSRFNLKLGRCINSSALLAVSKDSRSDVLTTLTAAAGLIASAFTSLPIDGIMGIVVSLFVLFSGYEVICNTVDLLLGKPADALLTEQIRRLALENEHIIGIHDLIIHDYGPSNMIGSCHAEVSSEENLEEIHDAVDCIEREIHSNLNVLMTIHIDPIRLNDDRLNACRETVLSIVKTIDERLSIHDFRMVSGSTHTNLIFDIVVPFDCEYTDEQIK